MRRGTAALLSGFAAVEVKKKGGRSVLRVLFMSPWGHSIENQTVKRTSSYRFEVGEGSLISLIIKALGSTPLGGEEKMLNACTPVQSQPGRRWR